MTKIRRSISAALAASNAPAFDIAGDAVGDEQGAMTNARHAQARR